MNKVTTTSTCGRCGVQEKGRKYAPIGWAAVDIIRRLMGPKWMNRQDLFVGLLCPPCQDAVLAVLRPTEGPVTTVATILPDAEILNQRLAGTAEKRWEAPDAD